MNILASIHPQYCVPIADRRKQVEIRKTKPKIAVPFKVYIYETKGRMTLKAKAMTPWRNGSTLTDFYICEGRGKVIGEFVCDEIYTFEYENGGFLIKGDIATTQDVLAMSYLSDYEFRRYAGDKTVYGWHISDLVIYDNPKELNELVTICPEWKKGYFDYKCMRCKHYFCNDADMRHECTVEGEIPITRPPQSWCYVAEVV